MPMDADARESPIDDDDGEEAGAPPPPSDEAMVVDADGPPEDIDESEEGAPPPPSDENIFDALKRIHDSIPDMSIVTLRQFRESAAVELGLGQEGLEDQKELVKGFAKILMNKDEPPEFDNGAVRHRDASDPVPMTFQRALSATSGLIRRKSKKPFFVPCVTPSIELCDLNTKDFMPANLVKSVVDVIMNYKADFTEEFVKKCVLDGDFAQLPAVARCTCRRPKNNPTGHSYRNVYKAIASHSHRN